MTGGKRFEVQCARESADEGLISRLRRLRTLNDRVFAFDIWTVRITLHSFFMKPTSQSKLSRSVTIPNELGLHARAAAKIVPLAEQARSGVFLIKDGQEADATSILDMMGLYCPRGTQVTVRITDPADEKVLNRIAGLIEAGFGES